MMYLHSIVYGIFAVGYGAGMKELIGRLDALKHHQVTDLNLKVETSIG